MRSKVVENVTESECVALVKELLAASFETDHPFDAWVISYPLHIPCANEVASDPQFSHIRQFVTGKAKQLPIRSIMLLNVYEARFLHGVMCAEETKRKNGEAIGMVIPTLQSPDYILSLHGFVAGVRLVSPSIKILIADTGSLYGLVGYRKAAEELVNKGVSCLASSVHALDPNIAAAAKGVPSVALYPFAREYVGRSVLLNVGIMWQRAVRDLFSSLLWSYPFILCIFVRLHTNMKAFKPLLELSFVQLSRNLVSFARNQSYPLQDEMSVANGTIIIEDISPDVTPEIREKLAELRRNMTAGQLLPFCTPHFNDIELFNQTEASFELSPGVTCLTPTGRSKLIGMPSGTELVLRFDEKNSPWVYRYIEWGSYPSVVLLVLVGLLVVVSLVGLVSVAINRQAAIYKTASPLFLGLILVGVLMGCISCILWIGYPNKSLCLAPWWLLGLSLSLIYSCVLAKNFRIWRIFSSDSLKLVSIMNLDLLAKFIASSFLIEVAILLTLTLYEPPAPTQDKGLSHLNYDEIQVMCKPRSTPTRSRYFLLAIFLYHFALLLGAAFMSFKTRKAKAGYRESESLAIVIGISMTIQIVIAFIYFAFPHNYKVVFFMFGYGIWSLMLTAYAGLFLPKFWDFHVRGYTAISGATNSSTTSTATLSKVRLSSFGSGTAHEEQGRDTYGPTAVEHSPTTSEDPGS
jgi:hypothetical protein